MILTALGVVGCVFVLLILHELGHVLAARALGIPVQKVGFSLTPFPHLFVRVRWPKDDTARRIYLFAGFAVYLLILSVCWLNNFFDSRSLLIALGVQLIIETNPIYSDFVIAQVINKVRVGSRSRRSYRAVYKDVLKGHLYSPPWYAHFVIWSILLIGVITLIRP